MIYYLKNYINIINTIVIGKVPLYKCFERYAASGGFVSNLVLVYRLYTMFIYHFSIRFVVL
jgi:glutathione synthase/RimK-type ligase-like ATP-grasp enzyme